jgi:hypothetical protein
MAGLGEMGRPDERRDMIKKSDLWDPLNMEINVIDRLLSDLSTNTIYICCGHVIESI